MKQNKVIKRNIIQVSVECGTPLIWDKIEIVACGILIPTQRLKLN